MTIKQLRKFIIDGVLDKVKENGTSGLEFIVEKVVTKETNKFIFELIGKGK